jgi:hypothetical protein
MTPQEDPQPDDDEENEESGRNGVFKWNTELQIRTTRPQARNVLVTEVKVLPRIACLSVEDMLTGPRPNIAPEHIKVPILPPNAETTWILRMFLEERLWNGATIGYVIAKSIHDESLGRMS